MRILTLLAASTLALGLATGLPLAAASPAPAPAAQPAQPAAAESSAPVTLSDLFTPAPLLRIGIQNGPCNVSVDCRNGATIYCAGRVACNWKGDGFPGSPGFVDCDGVKTTCTSPAPPF